jgi:hypothetical protein
MTAEALWTIDACSNALDDVLEGLDNGELSCALASSIVKNVKDRQAFLALHADVSKFVLHARRFAIAPQAEAESPHDLRELQGQESTKKFWAKLEQVQNELSRRQRRGADVGNKAALTDEQPCSRGATPATESCGPLDRSAEFPPAPISACAALPSEAAVVSAHTSPTDRPSARRAGAGGSRPYSASTRRRAEARPT